MAHHAEHKIARLCLNEDGAIVKHRSKHAVHTKTHIHNIAELQINNAAIEEAFLANLTQALIRNDIEAKMPKNPAIDCADYADGEEDKPDTEHLIIIWPNERWYDAKRG